MNLKKKKSKINSEIQVSNETGVGAVLIRNNSLRLMCWEACCSSHLCTAQSTKDKQSFSPPHFPSSSYA